MPAGVVPSKAVESDYRAAARAYLDGKLDEAGAGALRVALAGGDLDTDAFVLAARVAEAQHDEAKARRMYARAFQAECREGCDDPVQPPDARPASLAVAYPGIRAFTPSCLQVLGAEESKPPEALGPDGAFYLYGASGGVQVRAIPSRVLVDWVDVKTKRPTTLCLGAEARWIFVHVGGPPDALQLVPVGGGAEVSLRAPGPVFFLLSPDALLGANGDLLAPSFEDYGGERAWYAASPRASSLRPLPALHGAYTPAVLPGGDLVGLADKRSDKAGKWLGMFARFDRATGKLRAKIAPAPESGIARIVASRGGDRAFALAVSPRSLLMVDLGSGTTRSVPIPDGEPLGVAGPSSVVVATRGEVSLLDVSTGAASPAGLFAPAPEAALVAYAGPGIDLERDRGVLRLMRKVGNRYPTLQLRFAPGGKGGFAIDDAGYYEIFGEAPEALRAAATCHDAHPLDVCADRWEVPGLVDRFRRGDLSYRETD